MKKMALVLGTLLLAATASAKEVVAAPVMVEEITVEEAPVIEAPKVAKFRMVSVGQEFEYETRNTDAQDYADLKTFVKAAYGDDLTFKLSVENKWFVENENYAVDTNEDETHLGFRKAFTSESGNEYGVGLDYESGRGENGSDRDRIFLKQDYKYDILSGWIDLAYDFRDSDLKDNGQTQTDYIYSEAVPLKVQLGPIAIGYYYEFETAQGNDGEWFEQQIRTYFPIYSNEKWTVRGEYRLGLSKETTDGLTGNDLSNNVGQDYDFGDKNVLYTYVDYSVDSNLTLGAYLGLEAGTWNTDKNNANGDTEDSYYCDYGVYWDYKF